MSEHIVPVKNYVAVFLSLLILTALTTKVAYIDLGQTAFGKTHVIDWNTVAALVIAVAKMLLVVLFFMHVKYSPGVSGMISQVFGGLTRELEPGRLFWNRAESDYRVKTAERK
jgi:caa(3)-type oxidase subunit IV